ncbi:hypothetical protein SAMN05216334_1431, partial [Nitrosomonas ureae]
HKASPAAHPFNSSFTHQPAYALMIDPDSTIGQFNGNAGAAIRTITFAVYRHDLLDQSAVGNDSLVGRAFSPVIVTAVRYTKCFT